MTQTTTLKDIISIKQELEDITAIIKRCEDIQYEPISDYHKDRAKIFAYDELVKILLKKEGD